MIQGPVLLLLLVIGHIPTLEKAVLIFYNGCFSATYAACCLQVGHYYYYYFVPLCMCRMCIVKRLLLLGIDHISTLDKAGLFNVSTLENVKMSAPELHLMLVISSASLWYRSYTDPWQSSTVVRVGSMPLMMLVIYRSLVFVWWLSQLLSLLDIGQILTLE